MPPSSAAAATPVPSSNRSPNIPMWRHPAARIFSAHRLPCAPSQAFLGAASAARRRVLALGSLSREHAEEQHADLWCEPEAYKPHIQNEYIPPSASPLPSV